MTWEELQAVRNHQHCHSNYVIFLGDSALVRLAAQGKNQNRLISRLIRDINLKRLPPVFSLPPFFSRNLWLSCLFDAVFYVGVLSLMPPSYRLFGWTVYLTASAET